MSYLFVLKLCEGSIEARERTSSSWTDCFDWHYYGYAKEKRTHKITHSNFFEFTGKAFCGMIGAQTRHEYGVVGPTVNLSARLMVAAQKVLLPTPAPSPQQEEHQNHETTSASPPNGSRSITRSASSRILLDKKMPPVILCDEQTQKQCKAHFEFEILAPIKVKGKKSFFLQSKTECLLSLRNQAKWKKFQSFVH